MIEQKQVKGKNTVKLTFTLPVSAVGEKRDVRVLGDFNDWSWQNGVKMKAEKENYVGTIEVPAAASSYQFRYLVDETQWENDHGAANYHDNTYGTTNGVVHIDAPLMPAVASNGAAKAKAPAKKKAPAKAKAPAKGAVKPAAAKPTAKAPAKDKKAAAPKKEAAPKKTAATGKQDAPAKQPKEPKGGKRK
ncbi:MAG: isoamylase early set domain-containing protein [Saprospiraceae bacterium]